jgi:hypothetical protein
MISLITNHSVALADPGFENNMLRKLKAAKDVSLVDLAAP